MLTAEKIRELFSSLDASERIPPKTRFVLEEPLTPRT